MRRFQPKFCMHSSADQWLLPKFRTQNYVEIWAVNLLTFRPKFCTQHYAEISSEILHAEFCSIHNSAEISSEIVYVESWREFGVNSASRILRRFRTKFYMQNYGKISFEILHAAFCGDGGQNSACKVSAEILHAELCGDFGRKYAFIILQRFQPKNACRIL